MTPTRIGHDELREERRALAEEIGNVFATPEFHETWWKHYGGTRELMLSVVNAQDGRLVGVLPLYVWRRMPITVARFIGHGGGDELGPVARPGDMARVADALEALQVPLLLAEHMPARWSDALHVHRVLEERSPVLAVQSFAGWDDYLATRSSNFRQQVRGRPRRLAKAHEVRFRLADEKTLDMDLDVLFRLHRSRWPGGSEFADNEAFHRDFARVALQRGWTRLVVLEVDGTPAAAWYGFRFGDADLYYQSGRDAGLERESVGLVLLAHTIETAFADGRAEYRFLRGDEPYKFRFTDDDARVVTAVAGGRAALSAARAARLLRASRDAARRLPRSLPRARLGRASRPAA